MHTLEGDGYEWVCWHDKGPVLLAGGSACAWMFDASQGACMNVFAGHSAPVTCGCFTVDGIFDIINCLIQQGKKLCTGSDDGSIKIWDPKTSLFILVT